MYVDICHFRAIVGPSNGVLGRGCYIMAITWYDQYCVNLDIYGVDIMHRHHQPETLGKKNIANAPIGDGTRRILTSLLKVTQHPHEHREADEGDAEEGEASGVVEGFLDVAQGSAGDQVVQQGPQGPRGPHGELVDREAEQGAALLLVADGVVDDAVDRVEHASLARHEVLIGVLLAPRGVDLGAPAPPAVLPRGLEEHAVLLGGVEGRGHRRGRGREVGGGRGVRGVQQGRGRDGGHGAIDLKHENLYIPWRCPQHALPFGQPPRASLDAPVPPSTPPCLSRRLRASLDAPCPSP